jgi:hypothetical protein
MERQKAMECGSRKASSDVNPRNIYTGCSRRKGHYSGRS